MANGRYISYIRVSTARQGASGLGLEAQRSAIETYLNGGDWTVIKEFIEVESGKRNDRPALAEALKMCRKHKATLLIAKLDRLARNVYFTAGLMESGVEFIAVDNPAATKFTLHILAAVAEHEAEAISKRTKAALQAAKARGTVLGGRRESADWRAITANGHKSQTADAEAFRVRMLPIITEIGETIESANGIAAELNRRGETTRRGGQWSAVQVQRVLATA